MGRLLSEASDSSLARRDYVAAYTYDLVGNRLTYEHLDNTEDTLVTYVYNANDELTDEDATLDEDFLYATDYAYDANGSTLTRTRTQADGTVITTTSTIHELLQLPQSILRARRY